MNDFAMSNNVERLNSALLNMIYSKSDEQIISPTINQLSDVKESLNNIFEDTRCTDILFTLNTDKPYFGIKVDPAISANDALEIMVGVDRVKLSNYKIEFDSKLFEAGLDSNEIVAMLLYEISSMIGSYEAIDKVRAIIDLYSISNDDAVSIRDSANYAQLIIYAIKDTLYKVTSMMFVEDIHDLTLNPYIQSAELEKFIVSAKDTISSSNIGYLDSFRSANASVMQWMLIMYRDMRTNSSSVAETLKDAKEFTGSRLEKCEIDKTLNAIDHIDATLIYESSLDKALDLRGYSKLLEGSIFGGLKKKGLRSLQDAIYELTVQAKSASTEDEILYVIRGINSRLSIIEDYLYNTPDLPEGERKKWEAIAEQYRALRDYVSKKTPKTRQYGLFFDYSQLDNLDDPNQNA